MISELRSQLSSRTEAYCGVREIPAVGVSSSFPFITTTLDTDQDIFG